MTQAVVEELRDGADLHPPIAVALETPWLEVVPLGDGLPELRVFSEYARRLGSGKRNIGEASVLTWAELNTATAIVDERAAVTLGRERGVRVHGSLWLVVRGYKCGHLDERAASNLVDALADTQAWFPCSGEDLLEWARGVGLL